MSMSTNNNDQNGRQPPLPASAHSGPPTDPRPGAAAAAAAAASASKQQKQICRKFLWGTCTKSSTCKFRHVLDISEMQKCLKFCHDFQNKQGCNRPDCTYIHASREEHNNFYATGRIPRVLVERYATLSDTSSFSQNFEINQMMMSYVTPPPPPPPPPPAPIMMVGPAPPPPPPPQPMSFNPVQQPPPPPPPPTVTATSVAQTPPTFTGPPPQNTSVVFPVNQPPPPLPVFDASRPPPPTPNHVNKNGALKRPSDSIDAGPSKLRKPEPPKVDIPCEQCVQREIRIDMYKQKLAKMSSEEEYLSLMYKKKLEDYDRAKNMLRSLVTPELFRILDEYIEGGPPQVQDILAQLNQNPLITLMECFRSRNVVDTPSSPSYRLDETVLQSLTSITRRTNTSSSPQQQQQSDVLQVIMDFLHTVNPASERSHSIEFRASNTNMTSMSRPSTSTGQVSNVVNGLNRYTNGQKMHSPTSRASSSTPQMSNAIASTSGRGFMTPTSSIQNTTTVSSANPPAPPAPNLPQFHPAVPPPPFRPNYYPNQQGYATPTTSGHQVNAPMTMPPYNTMPRAPGPMQMAPRTSNPGVNYNQYMLGRYPQVPYYPPNQ